MEICRVYLYFELWSWNELIVWKPHPCSPAGATFKVPQGRTFTPLASPDSGHRKVTIARNFDNDGKVSTKLRKLYGWWEAPLRACELVIYYIDRRWAGGCCIVTVAPQLERETKVHEDFTITPVPYDLCASILSCHVMALVSALSIIVKSSRTFVCSSNHSWDIELILSSEENRTINIVASWQLGHLHLPIMVPFDSQRNARDLK